MHKIHGIVELENWRTLTVQNFRIFDANHVIKISLILHVAYVVLKDQEKTVFYVNNYINWD